MGVQDLEVNFYSMAEDGDGFLRRVSKVIMNRRRSSMFDIEGSRRQSRMEADSSLSFNSSTELFRDSGARQPRRRYENNYQLGPNEKPVLSEFRQTIKEVLETSCEGIDYELVDQANLVRSINATLHKKNKRSCSKTIQIHFTVNPF